MQDQNGQPIAPEEIQAILLYGAGALLLGGGAGIYIPMILGKGVAVDSLATYVFAILTPAFLDVLLFEDYWKKIPKVKRMLFGSLCTLAGALALVALLGARESWAMVAAWISTLLVLLIWFLLSLHTRRFRPDPPSEPPPKGSLGGEVVKTGNLGGAGLPS